MLRNDIFSAAFIIRYSVCAGAGGRPDLTPSDGGLNVTLQKRLLNSLKPPALNIKFYSSGTKSEQESPQGEMSQTAFPNEQ